jgi:hypothetical protein
MHFRHLNMKSTLPLNTGNENNLQNNLSQFTDKFGKPLVINWVQQ